ncbi:hypothetical protein Ocin01_13760 [Orchesella cincta]|uniref:Uncharacterized protein n=1 Tax=Orchesella cincta TaxID=48709 RepID=A0A1D2MIV5_ORCCI|nr:hypothetical protein Ocin01_13760 [Orchesella cincta]
MSIATLVLRWDSTDASKSGWRVKINGLIYSQREDFKKRFPKVKEEDPNGVTLVINPEDEPAFDRNNPFDMPMYVVIQYLKVLGDMRYKVVTSHSTAAPDNTHSMTMWTLQSK